jgi:hypothetical protein
MLVWKLVAVYGRNDILMAVYARDFPIGIFGLVIAFCAIRENPIRLFLLD